MEARMPRAWSWVWLSLMVSARLGIVIAAWVIANLRWGGWVAVIASLALLTTLAPAMIVLVCTRCLEISGDRARGLVLGIGWVRLVLALCLLVASFATGLFGLVTFCAICALWAVMYYVIARVVPPSDAQS